MPLYWLWTDTHESKNQWNGDKLNNLSIDSFKKDIESSFRKISFYQSILQIMSTLNIQIPELQERFFKLHITDFINDVDKYIEHSNFTDIKALTNLFENKKFQSLFQSWSQSNSEEDKGKQELIATYENIKQKMVIVDKQLKEQAMQRSHTETVITEPTTLQLRLQRYNEIISKTEWLTNLIEKYGWRILFSDKKIYNSILDPAFIAYIELLTDCLQKIGRAQHLVSSLKIIKEELSGREVPTQEDITSIENRFTQIYNESKKLFEEAAAKKPIEKNDQNQSKVANVYNAAKSKINDFFNWFGSLRFGG